MAAPLTPEDPPSLGAYRLAGRLGEGGQGVVYLAYPPDGEPVALKLLLRGDPETRTRLARELSALESVAPFCTARVLAASVDGPRPYVVSEFVDGPSLQQRIKERGPLRGGELERLVIGTATALAAIHAAGVVHRDFKPANVLLGPDGPRVVDFGIARAEGAATMTSGIVGTPAYLAPEQIGGAPASAASDVFAWAATMLCAASGRSPFGADTLPAVLHRILHAHPDLSVLPPRFAGLIGSCLDKDPTRRPTARSLMVGLVDPDTRSAASTEDLARIGTRIAAPDTALPHGTGTGDTDGTGDTGDTDGRRGTGAAGLGTRPSRRSRGTVGGAVLVAVSLVIAGGVAGWFLLGDHTASPSSRGSSSRPPTGPALPPAGTASPSPSPDGADTDGSGDTDGVADPGDVVDTAEPTPAPAGTTASQRPGSAGKVPASFAGTWSGHIKPSISYGSFREHDVKIDLVAGKSSGTWEEPTSGCTAALDLAKAGAGTLDFELRPDDPLNCVPGTLTLTRRGAVLAYHWIDGLGLVSYDGDLSRG
ncbi:serine/threonine-protein kinase [Streptosporangium sp. NPDC004631]